MGSDGNLYVAGRSPGAREESAFTVISLTPSGAERWVYDGPEPRNWGDAQSIVMGVDGNLYAAGAQLGVYCDFTVVSLTPTGRERWVYRYNGPGNYHDGALSIVVGSDSNLYAAGSSAGTVFECDLTVISLTLSGAERWIYCYNGLGNWLDAAHSVVMGGDGNLYVAGYSVGNGTDYDFTVISLTASGSERWVYRYNGPGNDLDEAYSIVMGSDGNLYAAGYSWGNGTSNDFIVISLTSGGGERWVYRYNRPGDCLDAASSIVMGSDGNLYASGYSGESETHYDFTIVSLTPSGGERWIYCCDDSVGRYRHDPSSIVMGGDGNLYAGGWTAHTGTGYDFTVVSLTLAGEERWVYTYNGSGNDGDWAHSIIMGSDGNLYAAGMTWAEAGGYVFTVISLTPDVGVEERPRARGKRQDARLELSAWPTPALGGVNIHYYLPKATEVKLAIYNSSGGLVKNLVNAAEEIGSKSVFWDGRDESGDEVPSGTYFCLLTQGGFTATTKVILLR